MAVLKKLGVLSVAKFYTIFMAILGLIIGIFNAISLLIFRKISPTLGNVEGVAELSQVGLGAGFSAVIILPILFAIVGFICGVIGAALYNLIAKWTGGIEMDFKK